MVSQEDLRRFRPALVSLTADQREVIDELVDGFDSRGEVLVWGQKTSVRTLGRLDDRFFRAVAMRPDVLDAFCGDEDRHRFRRGMMADRKLTEAMHDAYHSLRKQAHEYLDEFDEGYQPNPEEQEFIAMRPSLTEQDALQRQCVQQALDGFGDRDSVRQWVHKLREATEGTIPPEFVRVACYLPTAYRPLVGDYDDELKNRVSRETLVAKFVLPYCNAGVRSLHSGAGEQAQDVSTGMEVPQG